MSEILVHLEDGICTVTFNRPERKNSITAAMYTMLAEAVERVAADEGTRVLVIQGNEVVFSAGNDLGDFLNDPPSGQEAPVWRFMRAMSSFPKPAVAAVNGPAVGIGTTLLFHCDLVYAGDNAAFSMPFVNLGLCPENASSLLVPQMFGYHRAAEALMLGEPFMAEAALEAGLVNRVLPPLETNAYAQAQARKLAAKPLTSLIETKRLMKKASQTTVQALMQEEGEIFGRMLREPAAREAFSAFMDKRKPDFSKL